MLADGIRGNGLLNANKMGYSKREVCLLTGEEVYVLMNEQKVEVVVRSGVESVMQLCLPREAREEVEASLARLESNRGQAEYRVGEIYLPANASNMQAVAENGRRIMEQLSSGEVSFQDMATRFSQTTSASVGGDLGWLRLSQLPASLAEAEITVEWNGA